MLIFILIDSCYVSSYLYFSLFSLDLFILLFCLHESFNCIYVRMYVHHLNACCLWKSDELVGPLRVEWQTAVSPVSGLWESKLDPLQEQQALLNTEPIFFFLACLFIMLDRPQFS